MEEKMMQFEHKQGNITIKSKLPESAFKQQDLYILLMMWHKEKSIELWHKVREVSISNSTFSDNMGIQLKAEELPLDVLDVLMNKYIDMAIDFFTSRLA